jgi:hypothetical protein
LLVPASDSTDPELWVAPPAPAIPSESTGGSTSNSTEQPALATSTRNNRGHCTNPDALRQEGSPMVLFLPQNRSPRQRRIWGPHFCASPVLARRGAAPGRPMSHGTDIIHLIVKRASALCPMRLNNRLRTTGGITTAGSSRTGEVIALCGVTAGFWWARSAGRYAPRPAWRTPSRGGQCFSYERAIITPEEQRLLRAGILAIAPTA